MIQPAAALDVERLVAVDHDLGDRFVVNRGSIGSRKYRTLASKISSRDIGSRMGGMAMGVMTGFHHPPHQAGCQMLPMPPQTYSLNRLRQRIAAVVAGDEIRIARVRCGDRVAAHTQGRGGERGNAARQGTGSQGCAAIQKVTVPSGTPAPRRDGGDRGRKGHRLPERSPGSGTKSAWSSCSPRRPPRSGLLLPLLAV